MSRFSSKGKKWERARDRILERDNHTCGYCGNEASTVDHIEPKAAGGTDDDWNLIASCVSCNSAKGARVLVRLAYFDPDWIDYV